MNSMQHDKQLLVEISELHVQEQGGNSRDGIEMARMGKVQELKRTFSFVSIVGFVTLLSSTWESVLLASTYGLYNGGSAGVIWLTIIVWLCMLALIASIAEMASMAPTAGGQYHWVSEFAPRSLQAPLSYIVGWCCCLGWVAGIPSCALQLAALIQQMVLLVYPDIDIEELWQSTLLGFAFLGLTFAFNMFLARHLAMAESLMLFVHVVGFALFLIIMWTMADHIDAKTVFTSFNNGGGWSSQGVSTLVGLTTPLWCFIGADAGAHMSEELKDASLQLPRAMMWAIFGNGVMGIIMLITFCFCIRDLEVLLENDSTMPIVQILYGATKSQAGTIILCCLLALLLLFSTISTIATTSRQVWAFSRDKGLPFSRWIHWINPAWNAPLNALLISLGVSVVLLAINFGSDTALNAILSVSNAALIFSYMVSVGCIRLKRWRGETLLPRRWSLGQWGCFCNNIALAFLAVAFCFSFFPESPSIGDATWAADFNWAIVIFAATCLLAAGAWVAGGARQFVPPVTLVKPYAETE